MSMTAREVIALPIRLPAATRSRPQENSWAILSVPLRLAVALAERRRQRIALRDLAEMPQLLRDVGLTRAQALGEAAKPFWKA
jgi:uncharacterized protein YjiS (DUF1127 family)